MKEKFKVLCVAAGLPWSDEVPDVCAFEIEGGLVTLCQADEQTGDLLLEIALTPVPPERRDAAASMIAAANYRGMLTDGACLGLDPASGGVLLFRRLPMVSLDADGFLRVLTRFLDVAEQMNAALENVAHAKLAPGADKAGRKQAPPQYQMAV
jgi:hypothetical protein